MTDRDERLEAVKSALDELGGAFTDKFHALAAALRAVHDPSEDASAPAASPVGADPLWLDELDNYVQDVMPCCHKRKERDAIYRAVLAFAAAQPPSEAEIEAAWAEIDGRLCRGSLYPIIGKRIAKAALIAARARG